MRLTLAKPPSWLSPPEPIDLATLTDSFDPSHDTAPEPEMTFDHFFKSSPGLTTTMRFTQTLALSGNSTASSPATPRTIEPWQRWVGWSWDPPSHFFGDGFESPLVSPVASTFDRVVRTPVSLPYTTPLRPSHLSHFPHRTSAPRTAPRTVPRTRPVSERQAFAELVKCVHQSAKKKIASRSPAGTSVESADSVPWWGPAGLNSARGDASGGRGEVPLTPTPAMRSRDVTSNATGLTGSVGQSLRGRTSLGVHSNKVRSGVKGLQSDWMGSTWASRSANTVRGSIRQTGPGSGPQRDTLSRPLSPSRKADFGAGGRDGQRTLEEMESWHREIQGGMLVSGPLVGRDVFVGMGGEY
jgi:hypothetical protein